MKSTLSEHSKVYVWNSYSNQVKAEGTVLYTDSQHTVVDTGSEKIKADTVDVYPALFGPVHQADLPQTFLITTIDNDYNSAVDRFMLNAPSRMAADQWCTQQRCSAHSYAVSELYDFITETPKVDLCGN